MVEFHLRQRDIRDERVLSAMDEVPRERFIPPEYRSQAYSDGPLPIGQDQTISQPYIVALMTQHLRVEPDCSVLEIGTGCGYQTAVLSKLAKKVYTIERFAKLSERAAEVLGVLGVENVEFAVGDGSCGWPGGGEFDRIMITAAVPRIPDPVVDQLAEGGLVVAPVGSGTAQQLVAASKKRGKLIEMYICDVRFVKVIGEHGFNS